MTALTERFAEAVEYARSAHAGQVRKGSNVPYVYHPLAVSSLVLEFGGGEDQAIAALLHDVLEDCGAAHEAEIRRRFGDAVGNIVTACTDGTAESKQAAATPDQKRADWQRRKQAYIAHLAEESDDALLVSACDKLHNARAILGDLQNPAVGMMVFDRFTGRLDGTLRYYVSLVEVFEKRHCPVARSLRSTIEEMRQIIRDSGKGNLQGQA